MEKSEITKVLDGLKSLQNGDIVQDFEQKRALKEAIEYYERLQKENEDDCVRAVLQIAVTGEDIDDTMSAALEGGISYWCGGAEVEGDYLGEYASDQISRGGKLILHDAEEDETYTLSKEKFIEGLKKYIMAGNFDCIDRETDRYGTYTGNLNIDVYEIDGEAADCIIQYALFGDVIYG